MVHSFRFGAALAAVALLAACGGDDDDTPPPTGGTPTPSPTPTPTGTPTPSPFTYTKFAALTGTQTFATACAGTEGTNRPLFGPTPFGNAITLQSNRDPVTYTVTSSGINADYDTLNLSFAQADRKAGTPTGIEVYEKAAAGGNIDRLTTLSPAVRAGATLEYTRFAQLETRTAAYPVNLYCVYGVPTQPGDKQTATAETTTSYFFGNITTIASSGTGVVRTYDIPFSTSRFTLNPTTGAITIGLAIKGRLIENGVTSGTITEFGTFTATGTVADTAQAFDVQLLDSNSAARGRAAGWFFGPQRREVGYAISITTRTADNTDVRITGTVFAGGSTS